MNDMLLLGFVALIVLAALFLLFRGRRKVQQRCPACHRFGHGQHYGRFCCCSCGAHFVLNAAGKPSRSVWKVLYLPLSILAAAAMCLVFVLFTGTRVLPLDIVKSLIIVAAASWEFWWAFREKKFNQENTE